MPSVAIDDHLGIEHSCYRLVWREKIGHPKVLKILSMEARCTWVNLDEDDTPSDLLGIELLRSLSCLRV